MVLNLHYLERSKVSMFPLVNKFYLGLIRQLQFLRICFIETYLFETFGYKKKLIQILLPINNLNNAAKLIFTKN